MKYALLLIFLGLIVPQSVGIAAYKYSKLKNKYIKATQILIPPICYFLIAYLYWGNEANAIRESGNYVCGAFGAAAVFSTLIGTVIHLCLAVVIFFSLNYLLRKRL